MADDTSTTYLLVDGENIDWALSKLLSHKPEPGDRPRWAELVSFAADLWQNPVRSLFFINTGSGVTPQPLDQPLQGFVQALGKMEFQPILLHGPPNVKIVDVAIERTLQAIRRRGGDVLLASHDGDFAGEMKGLASLGRRVGILGFQELVSTKLREATDNTVFDLEDDIDAFEIVLPRTRPVHIDSFDPEPYL